MFNSEKRWLYFSTVIQMLINNNIFYTCFIKCSTKFYLLLFWAMVSVDLKVESGSGTEKFLMVSGVIFTVSKAGLLFKLLSSLFALSVQENSDRQTKPAVAIN
jgi:hypothetical protein